MEDHCPRDVQWGHAVTTELRDGVPALEVRDVWKTFNPGLPTERKALCGVDFELNSSDFAVIIGSNGAGKSTLMNAVAGEFVPDSGDVKIGGEVLTNSPVHRRAKRVARVFQNPSQGTAEGLTVEENMSVALKRGKRRGLNYSFSRSRNRRLCDALAPLGLGLEDRLKTPVELLSGGQRQALSLVMACLVRPEVLVLDEHCAALDPRTAEAVMTATIRAVEDAQVTTLMITHNMQHALECGNRLIMMHEGRIVFEADGTEKAKLDVPNLVEKFKVSSDRTLLV